jgi:hypothetical protein
MHNFPWMYMYCTLILVLSIPLLHPVVYPRNVFHFQKSIAVTGMELKKIQLGDFFKYIEFRILFKPSFSVKCNFWK